jgi:hypothetical protein
MSSAQFLAAARHAVTQASLVCRVVQKNLEQVRPSPRTTRAPSPSPTSPRRPSSPTSSREQLGTVILVGEEESNSLRDETRRSSPPPSPPSRRSGPRHRRVVVASIDIGRRDTSPQRLLDPRPRRRHQGLPPQPAVRRRPRLHRTRRPTVGALGCPNLPMDFNASMDEPDPKGCIYLAVRGDGVSESPRTIRVRTPRRITRLDHANRADPRLRLRRVRALQRRRHRPHPRPHRRTSSPIRLDSQAKYAVVARGQADAYLRLPTKKGYIERIWDHAAGALVAVEAGCFVTDIHGNPLDFSHGRGLEKNKGIVCAPPASTAS